MLFTISGHAKGQAFLQSTILTPIPVNTVNNAILVTWTLIANRSCLTSSEEALREIKVTVMH